MLFRMSDQPSSIHDKTPCHKQPDFVQLRLKNSTLKFLENTFNRTLQIKRKRLKNICHGLI